MGLSHLNQGHVVAWEGVRLALMCYPNIPDDLMTDKLENAIMPSADAQEPGDGPLPHPTGSHRPVQHAFSYSHSAFKTRNQQPYLQSNLQSCCSRY